MFHATESVISIFRYLYFSSNKYIYNLHMTEHYMFQTHRKHSCCLTCFKEIWPKIFYLYGCKCYGLFGSFCVCGVGGGGFGACHLTELIWMAAWRGGMLMGWGKDRKNKERRVSSQIWVMIVNEPQESKWLFYSTSQIRAILTWLKMEGLPDTPEGWWLSLVPRYLILH